VIAVTRNEIRAAVAAFERWHYEFDLDGVVTPIWRRDQANRHVQRRAYCFDAVVAWLGGDLAGKRVLDLGCNAGFWALAAVQAGCEYVLGIDGREMHVEQANLVFDVHGVDRARYSFVTEDVFSLDPADLGGFDIVLCLGLLYHVNRPVELFELMTAVCRDVLIVDTALSVAPGAYLEIRSESTSVARNALTDPLVTVPTALAVAALARAHGLETHMLRPRFTDTTGCWDYVHGKRRAFVITRDGRPRPGPRPAVEDVATYLSAPPPAR
jgi:2-polyprenyl-3-methyl-5-hydroxy-6-metoxy-1,4-benzoquinol methylase